MRSRLDSRVSEEVCLPPPTADHRPSTRDSPVRAGLQAKVVFLAFPPPTPLCTCVRMFPGWYVAHRSRFTESVRFEDEQRRGGNKIYS